MFVFCCLGRSCVLVTLSISFIIFTHAQFFVFFMWIVCMIYTCRSILILDYITFCFVVCDVEMPEWLPCRLVCATSISLFFLSCYYYRYNNCICNYQLPNYSCTTGTFIWLSPFFNISLKSHCYSPYKNYPFLSICQ